jgi:hypothetical protein
MAEVIPVVRYLIAGEDIHTDPHHSAQSYADESDQRDPLIAATAFSIAVPRVMRFCPND